MRSKATRFHGTHTTRGRTDGQSQSNQESADRESLVSGRAHNGQLTIDYRPCVPSHYSSLSGPPAFVSCSESVRLAGFCPGGESLSL